jgi:uncharacterized repeat protein (TIGR03803 family)
MVTPSGELRTLATFSGTNGAQPMSQLVLGPKGELYGTTLAGGIDFNGDPFTGNGTLFKVSRKGGLSIVHYFAGYPDDGALPEFGPLIRDREGNLYGTTQAGGVNGGGTIYRLNRSGTVSILHSWRSGEPWGGLTWDGTGLNCIGTTWQDGEFGYGTVFKLNVLSTEWQRATFLTANQR